MPEFRSTCAPKTAGDAALAPTAQGVPAAGPGWPDYERSSADSRRGRWNSESPVGTGARKAQAIDAPGARPTTSCTSDLHRVANHGREISSTRKRFYVDCSTSITAALHLSGGAATQRAHKSPRDC